jgi:hypothetical protein
MGVRRARWLRMHSGMLADFIFVPSYAYGKSVPPSFFSNAVCQQ